MSCFVGQEIIQLEFCEHFKRQSFHEHNIWWYNEVQGVSTTHLLKASSALRVLGVEVEVCLAEALESATGGGRALRIGGTAHVHARVFSIAVSAVQGHVPKVILSGVASGSAHGLPVDEPLWGRIKECVQ